jgi:glutathione synthase/RimK-type ligase-like ATP-grasp enzyme
VRVVHPPALVSESPRIALATCRDLPEGDTDDVAFAELLGARYAVWDDPDLDWSAFDLVLIRSTWDYQRRRDAFVAWARGLGDRLVNPPEVIAWNTDKRYLGDLVRAQLPVVRTMFVAPGQPYAPPPGEHVVKPTVSAGSRDTARFEPGEEARSAALVRAIHAGGRTAMVQPYVPSVDERGETALLYFDGAFSHAIRKGPILEAGADPTEELFAAEEIEARQPTAGERAAADRVVSWATGRFGAAPAYARVDLVEGTDGRSLLLELELTEPSLFFAHADGAAERFAEVVRRRLDR